MCLVGKAFWDHQQREREWRGYARGVSSTFPTWYGITAELAKAVCGMSSVFHREIFLELCGLELNKPEKVEK